jgi:anti-sigma B factor antagonist
MIGPGSLGQEFSIEVHENGDAVRVLVKGELDLATVPSLTAYLELVEQDGTSSIILDLEALTFMDATGLRRILTCRERALASGKAFSVEHCPDNVARVFVLTGQHAALEPAAPPGLPRS